MQVLDITKKAGQLGRELRQSQSDLVLPYRLCRWALDFCVLDFQLLWVDGGTRPMEVGDSLSHGPGADADAMKPLFTMSLWQNRVPDGKEQLWLSLRLRLHDG